MMRLPASVALVLVIAASGCSSSHGDSAMPNARHDTPGAMQPGRRIARGDMRPAIASAPDRGALVGYEAMRRTEKFGANLAYPVNLSEAHALGALAGQDLVIAAPDGTSIRLRSQRHEEYPSGNWTLVAAASDGARALITFGQDAVFGEIRRTDGSALRLETRHRQVYLVAVSREALAAEGAGQAGLSDIALPPAGRRQAAAGPAVASDSSTSGTGQVSAAAPALAAATATGPNDVDVLVGYSNGIVARIGSESGAVTRMESLVAITNEAYQNSGVTMRVRLVRSMLVNYTDSTSNQDALQKMTGSTGSGSIPVDSAFTALRAAREETGADLVAFVRQFREPEQEGCGIAWILGGGQTAITSSDAAFGYSVTSDGSDVRESNGRTYSCRSESLAHELGHNMGQAHNTEDSRNSSGQLLYGAHAYSFGYREAAAGGFFTVMAYSLRDANEVSTQLPIRYFANPAVNDQASGRPTGVANQSDNARSMNQTMPIVASFRQGVTQPPVVTRRPRQDLDGDGKSELIWQNGTQVSYWVVNGSSTVSTAYAGTLTDPAYTLLTTGDFNGDGRGDLIFDLQKPWARYLTRWINNGQGGFTASTQQYSTGGWAPVGSVDLDGDGKSELVWQSGTQIVYWVVNGASTVSSTFAGSLNDPSYRLVATGDFNGDGRGDMIFDLQKPWARYLTRWINNGQGFTSFTQEYANGGWVPVSGVDLDGDAKSEIIWQSGSEVAYWVVNGGATISSVYAGTLSDPAYQLVATGDYNGDGRGDLIFDLQKPWARYSTRWINTGQGFSSSTLQYANGGWFVPVQGLL